MRKDEPQTQIPEEILRWFEAFIRIASAHIRAVVQAAAQAFPELRAMAERQQAKSKRIRQLTHRKQKSQARNWKKWKRRRRRGGSGLG